MKLSAHLRTLASSWYGISGTPLWPIHLLAWLDMAARLDRFVGLIWLLRNLLSLDGDSPMSRNSFRMSSVIKMSPWNSSYPSNKRENIILRRNWSLLDFTVKCFSLSSVVHYVNSPRWRWSITSDRYWASISWYLYEREDGLLTFTSSVVAVHFHNHSKSCFCCVGFISFFSFRSCSAITW